MLTLFVALVLVTAVTGAAARPALLGVRSGHRDHLHRLRGRRLLGVAVLLPVLLIFISFIGGCAGSTAGSLKVIRLLIMGRQAVIEVTRLIHPRMVQPLRIGREII